MNAQNQSTNRRQSATRFYTPRRHECIPVTDDVEYLTIRELFTRLEAGELNLNDSNRAAFICIGGDGLPLSYAVILAAAEVEPYEIVSAVDPTLSYGTFQYHLRVFNLHPQSTQFCKTIRYIARPDEQVTIGRNPMTEAERRQYFGVIV